MEIKNEKWKLKWKNGNQSTIVKSFILFHNKTLWCTCWVLGHLLSRCWARIPVWTFFFYLLSFCNQSKMEIKKRSQANIVNFFTIFHVRSYQPKFTRSRLISEVKPVRARPVVRWVTTCEALVLNVNTLFFLHFFHFHFFIFIITIWYYNMLLSLFRHAIFNLRYYINKQEQKWKFSPNLHKSAKSFSTFAQVRKFVILIDSIGELGVINNWFSNHSFLQFYLSYIKGNDRSIPNLSLLWSNSFRKVV